MTLLDHVKRVYVPLLLSAYGVFLCSYFIFEDYSDPYRFYGRFLFVLGLFVFDRGIKSTWRHPLFHVIVAYMAYLLVSSFWSDLLDWYRLGQKFTICIYLFSFIAITYYLVNWNATWFDRMLRACTLFAAASAATSVVAFYSDNPFPDTRLISIGTHININEFANIYSVFAILALYFAMHSKSIAVKSVFLLAVVALLSVVWFGQSRTALASISIALLALVSLTRPRGRRLYGMALAILAAAFLIIFPEVAEQAFLRGPGLRPVIWAQVWDEVMAAPFFGHGITSIIAFDTGVHAVTETAHNAYLQVLWHGGITGLMLFLLLLGMALRVAWTRADRTRDYRIFCILLFTACAMMTGVDTIIERPRDQWMLFWFPLALLLAYECRNATTQVPPSLESAPSGTQRPERQPSAS